MSCAASAILSWSETQSAAAVVSASVQPDPGPDPGASQLQLESQHAPQLSNSEQEKTKLLELSQQVFKPDPPHLDESKDVSFQHVSVSAYVKQEEEDDEDDEEEEEEVEEEDEEEESGLIQSSLS